MVRDIDKIENVAALGLLLGAAGGSNEEAAAASAQAAAASAASASASAEEAATKLDEINETVDNIPSDYQELIDDVSTLKADFILQMDEIPNTVQSYTFADGTVSQIVHYRSGVAIRTDVFTYGENTITEVRTLNTGESLTIVTNLTTLETTVTYAAA